MSRNIEALGGMIRRFAVHRKGLRRRPGRGHVARHPGFERLEDRLCLDMALTQAGLDAGFRLTTFANNFPSSGGHGPLGIAFPSSGGVLVTDILGNVRLFPNDTDGQSASDVPPTQNYGGYNAWGLAELGNNIYMTQNSQDSGRVVQINSDGTLNRVVASLAYPGGIAADPATGHLFVSALQGIFDVDPASGTATLTLPGDASGNGRFYGIALSSDGGTLYAAGSTHVVGYNTSSGSVVFDSGSGFDRGIMLP